MKPRRSFLWKYVNCGTAGETIASSEKKARNNIRFKSIKENGRFNIQELRLEKEIFIYKKSVIKEGINQ